MTATSFIRADVVQELLDRLRLELGNDWSVSWGPPRDIADSFPRDAVLIGPISPSEFMIPTMVAGRKDRTDDFQFEVVMWSARPGDDPAETAGHCQTAMRALDNILADDPTLGGVDGLLAATLASPEGPDPHPTDEGYMSEAKATVECLCRYQ